MLPSQLNGAEYPSNDEIVTEFEEYLYDYTAGPAGQLSVHACIGQFIIDNASNNNNTDSVLSCAY